MVVDGITLTGPQGSNDAIVPRADNNYAHVAGLWDELGMPRSYEFLNATGAAAAVKFARDNYNPQPPPPHVLGRGRGFTGLLLRYAVCRQEDLGG